MHDIAHQWTDDEIRKLQLKFARVYGQAAKEMRKKLSDYLDEFDRANKDWQVELSLGNVTKKQYKAWLADEAMRKKYLVDMSHMLAYDAAHTNRLAADMINDALPMVYAENANYAAYGIEAELGKTHIFDLYDQDTIRHIMGMSEHDQLIHEVIPIGPPNTPLQSLRVDPDAVKDVLWNRQKFTAAITQSILQGESIPNTAKRLETVLNMNRSMATRAARTAMTSAENSGRRDSYWRAKRLGIQLEQQWLATTDERTRETHRLLDGQHVPVTSYFRPEGYGAEYSIRFPGDPAARGDMTWNCFIGETLVTTDSQIKASYRHEYVGELITIDTSSGVHFTCTPNHPILTPRGWVAAKSLNDGDNLLITGRSGAKRSFWKPNVNHAFASMETVHELFDVLFAKRATVTGVDFHGDIATSDVEVVAKKGFLGFRFDSCIFKRICKLAFKPSDTPDFCEGTTMKRLGRIVVAASRVMSGLGVCTPLIWGHGSHSNVHGLRATTGSDSSVTEYAIDNLPAETMVRSELLSRLSGQVFLDKVVNVKISSTRGTQVYNLQTDSGYYFANEQDNGKFIIAKNCRCTLIAWFPEDGQESLDDRWSDLPPGTTYEKWKHGKPKSVQTIEREKAERKKKKNGSS